MISRLLRSFRADDDRRRPAPRQPPKLVLLDWAATLALGVLAFVAFRDSPVHMLLDSKYSLLSSEVLLHERTWDLSRYLAWLKDVHEDLQEQGEVSRSSWQLRVSHGRLVYIYPPGTSLLSMPAVALMNATGLSSISEDGRYYRNGERRMQILLAAFLSALTVVVCVRLARRELPLPHALVMGLVAGFGTAIWSTASRTLWMQTWGVLLTAAAMLELLRWDDGERRRPELLGFLLVAAFWVRPTSALLAGAATLYVLWRHRPAFLRLVATGALGALGYLAYTRIVWGAAVQGYMRQARHLGNLDLVVGVRRLLVDAERGVLIWSSFFVVTLIVLLRLGIRRERRPYALFAGVLLASYMGLYGSVRWWWGTGTVGYRYLTEISPVLVWVAAYAWRRQREERARLGPAWRLGVAALAVASVAASVVAHSTGAFNYTGSAEKRGLRAPMSAWPEGSGKPLSYLERIPHRIPLAYWGLVPRGGPEPAADDPAADPAPKRGRKKSGPES